MEVYTDNTKSYIKILAIQKLVFKKLANTKRKIFLYAK